jgi:hypothetical protein
MHQGPDSVGWLRRRKLNTPSFRRMPEKWCTDAPLTDLKMESSKALNSLDPGIRQDDEPGAKQAFLDKHQTSRLSC